VCLQRISCNVSDVPAMRFLQRIRDASMGMADFQVMNTYSHP
jgi:hypothetical protein